MSLPLSVPIGELSWLGIGKETAFGTPVLPTIYHPHLGYTGGDKNEMLPRTGARKRLGQTYPATGAYTAKPSFSVETDPDTFPQLLAYALGQQTTPALTGGSTTAYVSNMKLGTPLPTFTIMLNRVIDTLQYAGCKVSELTLSMGRSGGLTCKVAAYAQSVIVNATPPTPVFSELYPFEFYTPGSQFVFDGTPIGLVGEIAVSDWEWTVSNNLLDTYYSFGNGRFILAFPEQQRKVAGKATVGFENASAWHAFLGGATVPGASIPPVSIATTVASVDFADVSQNIQNEVTLTSQKCFIESSDPDIKPSGVIMLPLVYSCAESANGMQDDLAATLTNTIAAAY